MNKDSADGEWRNPYSANNLEIEKLLYRWGKQYLRSIDGLENARIGVAVVELLLDVHALAREEIPGEADGEH